MLDNIFHAHLDVCAQCRNNPFGLCQAGDVALHAAVHNDTDELLKEPVERPSALDIVGMAHGKTQAEMSMVKKFAEDVFGPFAYLVTGELPLNESES